MQLVRFPNEWLVWISFFFIESNPLHNSGSRIHEKNYLWIRSYIESNLYNSLIAKGSCMLAIFLVNSNQTTISVV